MYTNFSVITTVKYFIHFMLYVQAHLTSALAVLPQYVSSYNSAAWNSCLGLLRQRLLQAASS